MGAAVLARDQSMFENLEVYQFRNWLRECPVEILYVAWVNTKQYKQINKDTNCIYQSFSAVNGNEGVHLFKS